MKKYIKSFWFCILMFILLATSVFAPDVLCPETTTTGTTTFSSMLLNTFQNVTMTGDQHFSSFNDINPDTAFVLEKNETKHIIVGSTSDLNWSTIDASTSVVYNLSNGVAMPLSATNDFSFSGSSCSGNISPCANLLDESDLTGASMNDSGGSGTLELNFTVPACAVSTSSFLISINASTDGIAVPSQCWASLLQFRAVLVNTTDQVNTSDGTMSCWNTTHWQTFKTYTGMEILYCPGVQWAYTSYSVNTTTGVISWDGDATCWNNTDVYVLYNKTFSTSLDLADAEYTWAWETDSNIDWGDDTGWRVLTVDLNNTDWDTNHTYVYRTCAARNSCRSTQVTIYSAFSVIALLVIVGAAFVLTSMFNGGEIKTAALGALAVGAIGLAITVMIGFTIINRVGSTVCLN